MEIKNAFLARLREETMPLHKEVESSVISKAIISPGVTRDEYVTYLSKVLAIHSDVENTVFPVAGKIIADIEARKKAAFITADLLKLTDTNALTASRFLDAHYQNDLSFNLGLLYVTEGSTLGGQFILKNIRAALGSHAPAGFLNVYGERTGSMWKAFMAALQDYEATLNHEGQEQVVAGALYGFERVKHIFN